MTLRCSVLYQTLWGLGGCYEAVAVWAIISVIFIAIDVEDNNLAVRKYTLKYYRINIYDICNLFSKIVP